VGKDYEIESSTARSKPLRDAHAHISNTKPYLCFLLIVGSGGRQNNGGESFGGQQQTMVRGVFELQQRYRQQTVAGRQREPIGRSTVRIRSRRANARHCRLRRTVADPFVRRLLGEQRLSESRGQSSEQFDRKIQLIYVLGS